MDQTIHPIRVGSENYNGPHLTKDCDLDENGHRQVQDFYSSGDRFDKDQRNPKKKCKKSKEEKYKQRGRGFYQRQEPALEKKPDFKLMLTLFTTASEKRHKKQMNQLESNKL